MKYVNNEKTDKKYNKLKVGSLFAGVGGYVRHLKMLDLRLFGQMKLILMHVKRMNAIIEKLIFLRKVLKT